METTKVTIVALLRGQFSDRGNFSGYNSAGIRIHVPGQMMKDLGYTPESEKVDFPLYACVVEREFNVLAEDGVTETGEKFKRLQAGSIFKTKREAIDARNADALLEAEAESELFKSAKEYGLTEQQLTALAASSF